MNDVIGEVNFSFSSRFSQLIGRNLISNPIVAVSELVKNSYDADADNIFVEFYNLLSDNPTLKIIDDGDGMSFEDVQTKWMLVGTANKVLNPYTKKGRRKLGEKGIGRFSVERLARKLTVTSSRMGEDFAISFSIDWDEYEIFEGEFHQLKHKVKKIPYIKESKGTEMVLEGLRDKWDKETLINLQKELELLRPIDISSVSYKKYKLDSNNVNINLKAIEILKSNKFTKSNFIDFAQAHLFGEIFKDGSSIIKVQINSNISASNSEISEEYTYSNSDFYNSCGPISFEAFVFLKDKRLYKSLNVDSKNINEYLNTFSGVKIYRNGFRILPFGDVDNDWLELNSKRTGSPEFRIATYNTIGIVYITRDDNPGLQDVLSRENMYETNEFISLKYFVNRVFDKYTELQLSARKKKDRKILEDGLVALSNAQKAVSVFSYEIGTLKQTVNDSQDNQTIEQRNTHIADVEKQVSRLVSTAEFSLEKLKLAYTYYKRQSDFRSREMQIYRNIATLGISAAMFGHEALNQTVDSKSIIKNVLYEHKSLIESSQELHQQLQDLYADLKLIDEKADFFRNYLQKEKQDRSRYLNIYSILIRIINQHRNAFNSINAQIEIQTIGDNDDFITWAYEGDIEAIFTNLITNAYKALKREGESKFLKFSILHENGNIIINTMNNGTIISMENRHRIFEPLFSTYSDGTGLGLTIVLDTLLQYKGSIKLLDDFPITHFEIIIPRQQDDKQGVE